MSLRGIKRKRKAISFVPKSGLLFLQEKTPLKVMDGDLLWIGGKAWRGRVLENSVDFSLVVSKDDKREQARTCRLNLLNEIKHRKLEADALNNQIQSTLVELNEVYYNPEPTNPTCTLLNHK